MTELALQETGSRGQPTIVFLHGVGNTAAMWDKLAAALPDYHCLAPDLPGHGGSRAVRWQSRSDTARRIAALIEARATGGRAHVVGLSLGGSVVLELLTTRPDLLDRVIVDGCGALPSAVTGPMKLGVVAISPFLRFGVVARAIGRAFGISAGPGLDEFVSQIQSAGPMRGRSDAHSPTRTKRASRTPSSPRRVRRCSLQASVSFVTCGSPIECSPSGCRQPRRGWFWGSGMAGVRSSCRTFTGGWSRRGLRGRHSRQSFISRRSGSPLAGGSQLRPARTEPRRNEVVWASQSNGCPGTGVTEVRIPLAAEQVGCGRAIARSRVRSTSPSRFGVDIHWLPLGARGRWLRLGGKIFEVISALIARRAPLDIYHSVLEVFVQEGRYVIEMGPAVDDDGKRRGVVARGSVGTTWAAKFRLLRYEVRCWLDGTTAFDYAVESCCLTDDVEVARQVLQLAAHIPTPVWGRDALGAGDMWTCNSLTSWLLGRTGLCDSIQPPAGGRAPGWDAGLTLARRAATTW